MGKNTDKKKKLQAIDESEIIEENIPAILHVCGGERDPNLQDVPYRDIPKYLRERFWIEQWSPSKRWKLSGFINAGGWSSLRLTDLGRKLNDPGDAFFDLILTTPQYIVRVRSWAEVTEVFSPGNALKVNRFIREYNGLRGKGTIDERAFLDSLNLGPPHPRLQYEMADEVIAAIKRKTQKGREGGSYKTLVRDYGRGALIVGLPLWFAMFPSDPADPSTVLSDFVTRLGLGLKAIEHSLLRANWNPFDSVVVLWNPTLESIDSWVRDADPHFYSDPINLSWQTPVAWPNMQSRYRSRNLPNPDTIKNIIRWDRYSSLDSMLADQCRRIRFANNPRPLGPKARVEVHREGLSSTLRMAFYSWLLQVWLFVRLNGWRGLRRKIFGQISIRRLFTRWRLLRQARKIYLSSCTEEQTKRWCDRITDKWVS